MMIQSSSQNSVQSTIQTNLNSHVQTVQMDKSWLQYLQPEFEKPYMKQLKEFLRSEKQQGKVIYPKGADYFAAFNRTPFEQVKVVVLGQDPYHGDGEAHGLCFSVPQGIAIPPSLRNIYQELKSDLGCAVPKHGTLYHWADQGVLLLNSILTVEKDQAASHRNKGWETFTDRVIDVLNQQKEGLVFILWGSYAQKKASFVDTQKHLVIKGVHPSPLSAHRGFMGSKPFSKVNEYLERTGRTPIDWQIS